MKEYMLPFTMTDEIINLVIEIKNIKIMVISYKKYASKQIYIQVKKPTTKIFLKSIQLAFILLFIFFSIKEYILNNYQDYSDIYPNICKIEYK